MHWEAARRSAQGGGCVQLPAARALGSDPGRAQGLAGTCTTSVLRIAPDLVRPWPLAFAVDYALDEWPLGPAPDWASRELLLVAAGPGTVLVSAVRG